MREISFAEASYVAGGDAAVTRPPGTNSWGEPNIGGNVGNTTYFVTVQVGPISVTTSKNAETGAVTNTACVQTGANVSGPMGGGGVTAGKCVDFGNFGGDLFKAKKSEDLTSGW